MLLMLVLVCLCCDDFDNKLEHIFMPYSDSIGWMPCMGEGDVLSK
jgi:hypothetical protein